MALAVRIRRCWSHRWSLLRSHFRMVAIRESLRCGVDFAIGALYRCDTREVSMLALGFHTRRLR
jgi:hypothetical protein